MLRHAAALFVLLLVVVAAARGQRTRPKKTIEAAPQPLSPYILYGPHGYQTFPHSRCQEVSQWLVISVQGCTGYQPDRIIRLFHIRNPVGFLNSGQICSQDFRVYMYNIHTVQKCTWRAEYFVYSKMQMCTCLQFFIKKRQEYEAVKKVKMFSINSQL